MDTREALANGECWGPSGAVPIPGDYDGDGADDAAIYDPGTRTWNIYSVKRDEFLLRDGVWGVEGATPVSADYDGDGKADPALYQESSGTWSGLLSGNGYQLGTLSFGAQGGVPVPADYNGDGRAEPALYSSEAGKYYIWIWSQWTFLEFNAPTGGVACPGRFYFSDVYNMTLFQTGVEASHGVMGNGGGKFDIIIPEGSSPLNNGIIAGLAAFSAIVAPISFGLQVFDVGYGILQAVGVIPDPQQQMIEMLNQMDKKLDEINGRLGVIEKKLDELMKLIELKIEELKVEGWYGKIADKISFILNNHATLSKMASKDYRTNTPFDTRTQDMSTLLETLDKKDIQNLMGEMGVNMLEGLSVSGEGFIDLFTNHLINNHIKRGKNPLFCYLNLEYMFGRVLTYEYRGAQLTMEFLERKKGAAAATHWRDDTFLAGKYGILAQTDKFYNCVHRLVEAATDTGFYLVCPEADRRFLPKDVTEIYSRANFVASYLSPKKYFSGLVGQLIGEPGRIKKYGDDKLVKANYTAPPCEKNGLLKDTRITKEVPLMRRELRTAPAMTKNLFPYASSAEWLIYEQHSPGSYHVTTTKEMAFDLFALANAPAGDYQITVAGERESEPSQTVTVKWRSKDYVTLVSPDTPDAKLYGYFVVPVRHYVGDHPGSAPWKDPVRRYFTDWQQFIWQIKFSFSDDRYFNYICHHVSIDTLPWDPFSTGPGGPNNFWFLWEDSVPISLPKKADAMNNRIVGLYAKSWLEWKGNNQESQLWHTIGIGNDLADYDGRADCVHKPDVRCVEPTKFDGEATAIGSVKPSREHLSVFSSARGRCWRPYGWNIDAWEKVYVDRMILYIPEGQGSGQ